MESAEADAMRAYLDFPTAAGFRALDALITQRERAALLKDHPGVVDLDSRRAPKNHSAHLGAVRLATGVSDALEAATK
jgi:hypothetical protein